MELCRGEKISQRSMSSERLLAECLVQKIQQPAFHLEKIKYRSSFAFVDVGSMCSQIS
jgi:hypothetical protein